MIFKITIHLKLTVKYSNHTRYVLAIKSQLKKNSKNIIGVIYILCLYVSVRVDLASFLYISDIINYTFSTQAYILQTGK